MTEDQKAVVTRALDTWGVQEQLQMLVGEVGEMLVHVGRMAQGRYDPVAFGEEAADVVVMCESAHQIDRLRAKLDALGASTTHGPSLPHAA